MNRRDFLKSSIKTGAVASTLPLAEKISAEENNTYTETHKRRPGHLSWLEHSEPKEQSGQTWGLAWKQGSLQKNQELRLLDENGKPQPLQTWITAWWPDGSAKWTAHAIPANTKIGKQFKVEPGKAPAPIQPVKITETKKHIRVDTGVFSCEIEKNGHYLVNKLERNGKLIAQKVKLTGLSQNKPYGEPGEALVQEAFESRVTQTTVEQHGPVRAVIKLEGVHRTQKKREWLPFSLRLYFYAGSEALRITHTFIYDGDDQIDFICGLGLQTEIPMRDELYNRHVRFSEENAGLWSESPMGITGLRRDPGAEVRAAQIAGITTPPLKAWDERVSSRLHWIPVWNDYTLTQLNAKGFAIRKRTKAGHAWIDADQGERASGAAYVGGVSGGLLFGMRDFWQLHPAQIDIRNAGTDLATATLWYWSPEAPAMDVRFYHDGLGQETYEQQLDALNITYEDYEPGFGQAHGVARTTEFSFFVLDKTPSRQRTVDIAQSIAQPPQIVAAPEDYLEAGVFGSLWSMPDHSTAEKKFIENRLNWSVNFYRQQVEQRHWYGFWNYGDIMHTYDADRHVWRYDIGGYAWDNSELSPDLWLWYSFLRTGDAHTFRLAEAMTRHNRDVDIYHLGRFKGLGTRHNVQHWGCSAKQLRISTAAYRRFHYFLTGDERTGDVLTEVINADEQLEQLIPTRKLPDKKPMPTKARISVGTDWGSVAANWLTAWERTGDDTFRDWLEASMRTIGQHPLGFFAGTFGYDAKNKKLLPPENQQAGISHLNAVFGLIEICAELTQLLNVPEFNEAWLHYARFYNADPQTQAAEFGHALQGNSLTVAHSRLTAWVAAQTKNKQLAERAWKEFASEWTSVKTPATTRVKGPDVLNPVDEAAWVSTNDAAQWGLAAIQNLALIAESLKK